MYLKYLVWTKTITCIFHKILKNFSFTGNTYNSIYRVLSRSGGWRRNLSPTSALLGKVTCGPMGF